MVTESTADLKWLIIPVWSIDDSSLPGLQKTINMIQEEEMDPMIVIGLRLKMFPYNHLFKKISWNYGSFIK